MCQVEITFVMWWGVCWICQGAWCNEQNGLEVWCDVLWRCMTWCNVDGWLTSILPVKISIISPFTFHYNPHLWETISLLGASLLIRDHSWFSKVDNTLNSYGHVVWCWVLWVAGRVTGPLIGTLIPKDVRSLFTNMTYTLTDLREATCPPSVGLVINSLILLKNDGHNRADTKHTSSLGRLTFTPNSAT